MSAGSTAGRNAAGVLTTTPVPRMLVEPIGPAADLASGDETTTVEATDETENFNRFKHYGNKLTCLSRWLACGCCWLECRARLSVRSGASPLRAGIHQRKAGKRTHSRASKRRTGRAEARQRSWLKRLCFGVCSRPACLCECLCLSNCSGGNGRRWRAGRRARPCVCLRVRA